MNNSIFCPSMCMGFGCNAAGVVSTRIIDSKRDKLVAILTNNFVPCNGRYPALIVLSAVFMACVGLKSNTFSTAVLVLTAVVASIGVTLVVSKILSETVLKGIPTDFVLELPPYRRPQFLKVITRSIFDRTLFVLGRAVMVAAPAGIVIWTLQNITIGDYTLLALIAQTLDPIARVMGMDGVILTAFIVGMPANEIVIPVMIMCYLSQSSLQQVDNITEIGKLLVLNGWTATTAVCTMIFFLNHFPCSTTLITIAKETKSIKWTFLSFLLPTLVGAAICSVVAFVF